MPKSMVEKYEQILAEDPSSTVFVELARELIEKGEYERAIEVSRTGLSYRNDSVLGRVLWGKALINLGRPAEAMEQFEHAVAIDRTNAHPYNLVAEVLIQRGLYRSAVPLLRKATVLQPNSGRIRELLEQTQQALSGGPAPVLKVGTPLEPAPPSAPAANSAPARRELKPKAESAPSEKLDPFAPVEGSSTQPAGAEVGGLSEAFAALGQGHRKSPPKLERVARAAVLPPPVEDPPPPVDNAPRPAYELSSPVEEFPQVEELPQLEEIPPPVSSSGSLLLDVPELPDVEAPIELPRMQVSKAATEAIADQYEKELRQRLDEASARKTFWQAHWWKVAVGAVLAVLLAVVPASYIRTRSKNKGRDLKDAMAYAKKEIARDTPKSYRDALASLNDALSMDDSTEEAWALSGYVRSLLYAEYGGSSEDRQQAETALRRADAPQKFPALALVAQYYLADPAGKEAARKASLASGIDQTEVHELAGKILLNQADNPQNALNRFDRALKLFPNNIRALAALGDYYRGSGDCSNAINLYVRAMQVSPQHGASVIGAAECRLELSQDAEESLKQVEALPRSEDLPPDLVRRRELARGRLLAISGKPEEAIKALTAGLQSFRSHAFEFTLALGEANRIRGALNEAQRQFESALKLNRQSEEAKEGLGRALLAHDLERELLKRIPPQPESRKVSLIRGIAFAHLEDWKHMRTELARTQVNGKYPSESVIYLSLADAAQGQSDRAVEILEKMLASARRSRGEIRVALGKIYWDRGALDKARAQFEEASKEPWDYEGACSLGRLLVKLGLSESAAAPLAQSIARNPFHAEARYALSRTYLDLGRAPEALKILEGAPEPLAAAGQRNLAFALYQAGRFKDADAAIQRALKLEPDDVEGNRIRASTLFALGEPNGAMKALERANKLDPKDPQTFCEIGRGFIRQNNVEMAHKAFAAGMEKRPDLLCAIAGEHLARLGREKPSSAGKDINDNLQAAHTPWERAFALAVVARLCLSAGNAAEARKAAEEAVRLSPFGGEGHLVLGLAAHRLKDDAAARDSLLKAVELEPAFAGAHLALADFLGRGNLDDLPRAISEYESFLQLSNAGDEESRVKRVLSNLKKKVAAR